VKNSKTVLLRNPRFIYARLSSAGIYPFYLTKRFREAKLIYTPEFPAKNLKAMEPSGETDEKSFAAGIHQKPPEASKEGPRG